MLFKSPCCLRSDSCSILFLQYANDDDMDEFKGGPWKVHDTFFTKGISQTEREWVSSQCFWRLAHRIHVWYIFTYIYHKNQLNVGKYTIHGWYGLVVLHGKDTSSHLSCLEIDFVDGDLLERKRGLHTLLAKNERSHYAHVGCFFVAFEGFWIFWGMALSVGKHSFFCLAHFLFVDFPWFSYGMMKSPNFKGFMGNSDFHISCKKVPSLKRSINGWNSRFVLGWPIFRCYVSFRECTILDSKNKPKSTRTHFLMEVFGTTLVNELICSWSFARSMRGVFRGEIFVFHI